MVQKLLHSCALLWILGIFGMWAARAFLGHGEAPFHVAAGCWVLGGVGFTWFAVLGCLEGSRAGADARARAAHASAPDPSPATRH